MFAPNSADGGVIAETLCELRAERRRPSAGAAATAKHARMRVSPHGQPSSHSLRLHQNRARIHDLEAHRSKVRCETLPGSVVAMTRSAAPPVVHGARDDGALQAAATNACGWPSRRCRARRPSRSSGRRGRRVRSRGPRIAQSQGGRTVASLRRSPRRRRAGPEGRRALPDRAPRTLR